MQSTLEALNATIERAFNLSPYYAEVFQGHNLRLSALHDLRNLPMLTREVLIRNSYRLMTRGSVPATLGFTSGTTLDRQPAKLLFWKTLDETQTKEALIKSLRSQTCPTPLVLHLVNLGHGLDPGGAREGCLQVPLERMYHFDVIINLLRTNFDFPGFQPRISAVAGPLRILKALTMLCLERGIDSSDFRVDMVSSSSNHLTSRWRTLLRQFWRAEVDEVYGLSEVPGLHASRCRDCGRFHFSPLAVSEVLDLETDAPISSGSGRLIATSLYPLAAMQPIIRYDTGDMIHLFGRCEATGCEGFEFLGRTADVVRIPHSGDQVVIAPTAVHEVLDQFPDIACEQFAFCRYLDLKSSIGQQKWKLAFEATPAKNTLHLDIELRWSALQFPDHAEKLEDRVRKRLLTAIPALAESVARGEAAFQIHFHEPESSCFRAPV